MLNARIISMFISRYFQSNVLKASLFHAHYSEKRWDACILSEKHVALTSNNAKDAQLPNSTFQHSYASSSHQNKLPAVLRNNGTSAGWEEVWGTTHINIRPLHALYYMRVLQKLLTRCCCETHDEKVLYESDSYSNPTFLKQCWGKLLLKVGYVFFQQRFRKPSRAKH